MDECPICYEMKPQTILSPCNHKFCAKCLIKYLKRGQTCPLCRRNFHNVHPPLVVYENNFNGIIEVKLQRKTKNDFFGISVIQAHDGVRISKIHNKKLNKLQIGQKIVAYNGLPCYNKAHFINSISDINELSIFVTKHNNMESFL